MRVPAGRLPVKAKSSRQKAGLDSEPPGCEKQMGVSRPLGGSPHFSLLEVSPCSMLLLSVLARAAQALPCCGSAVALMG